MNRRDFLRSALALGAVLPALPFLPKSVGATSLPKLLPTTLSANWSLVKYGLMSRDSVARLYGINWSDVKTLGPMKVTRWKEMR